STSSGTPKQLSKPCQLFITHTSPAGPIARSVCICRPPPTYPPGGEIWSPVCSLSAARAMRPSEPTLPGLVTMEGSKNDGPVRLGDLIRDSKLLWLYCRECFQSEMSIRLPFHCHRTCLCPRSASA